MEAFCGSKFWDYDLTWNTTDPDFTPCFLNTVLVYAPCIFLLVLAPLDIHYARTSKYANIPWSWNNGLRLLLNVLLIAVSVADLIVAATWENAEEQFDVHLVTPSVKIATFIIASGLILLHRKRGINSSGVLFMFWFALAVLAIPQFRHEIRQFGQRPGASTIGTDQFAWADYHFISNIVYFTLVLVQLGAHFFSDAPARSSRYDHIQQDNPCPELRVSFFNRILFAWFDPMAWKGFRRPLVASDLWNINPADTSEAMAPKFDKFWQENVEKKERVAASKKLNAKWTDAQNPTAGQKRTQGNIVPVLFRTFGAQFYLAGLLKLAIDLLSFAPPQILGLMITFTAVSSIPMWHGIVYTIALLAISLLSALLNGQHTYLAVLVGYRIRTVLISAIYRKSLRLSNAARRETTVGEVVNLMSVDAQRFLELITYLHMAWAAPLVVAISMYFLYDVLGVAAFAGLAVLFIMIPISGFIATKLKYFQVQQMIKKDERIKMMNEILGGIKVLKLYAWEPSFEAAVDKTREEELRIIKHAAITNAFIFLQFNMVPFLVMLVTFLVYMFVDPENNKMSPNTFFVALSLFNVLRSPMTMFPLMVTQMMQGWVAVRRINNYLNYEDLDPHAVSNEPDARALTISKGTFSWGAEDGNVLTDVNVEVQKGDLAAVVGPVGCGKSSLVFSLLGDTKKIHGSVNIDGTMAYVAQQAWIQNATLQDNILFGLPMDPEFYNKVLEACALATDLKILPGGDQTEIGEKGINLSGGQKQRVALARAVYARADIYLLDDPLSAVDSHVGKHIFEKVIGPAGILAGKTRLLVTHGISYLPQTDNIFVLNGGAITESGPYAQLVEQKGAFAEFLEQHLQNVDATDEEELLAIKEALVHTKTGAQIFERAISVRNSLPKKKHSLQSLGKSSLSKKTAVNVAPPPASQGTKLIQMEVSAVGGVGLTVYLRYFSSIGWLLTGMTIGGSIAHQAISVFSNNWLSEWSAHPNVNDPEIRDLYLGVYGGLGILTGAALFLSSISMAFGCLYASRNLHSNLLHRTLRLPMAFFDTTPVGRVMNRFTKDVDIVDNVLPQVIRAWMIMFFSTLGILIVISISTPIFIAVIVPLAILYYFIQRFFVATSRQLKRIESVTRSPIYSHFGETIAGQTTIRAYGAQDRFRLTSERHVDHNQQCFYPSLIAGRWLGVRLEIIGALVLLFAALFAVLARGTISSELVGLSITYALQITATLSFLVRLTAEVETHIVANERMEEYSTEPTEADWETEQKVDKKWPVEGVVKFDNYQLRYREGLDLVLHGITLDIRGGEKVGIVGRTGAGKSSLTLALFRLIEAAGGSISIDGVPIAKLGLHALRSRLTIIPQDPVLFSGTLRMNVDPFAVYTDEDIWRVLEHAHLKTFVKGTQAGLGYEIAEGGENLSIGQRQLVCLARALLRKTKVLILDEATAAIDLETDDLIQTTIRTQFKECTVLTIAHRLNTILDSDRVLVLDKGMVAEMDTPQNLLNDRQSIFYGMAKDAGLTNALAGDINN